MDVLVAGISANQGQQVSKINQFLSEMKTFNEIEAEIGTATERIAGLSTQQCVLLCHIARALEPDQVIALHVDNGLMRHRDSDRVEESLRALGLQLSGPFLCI